MKRTYPKILRNRKQRIQRRLDPHRGWADQAEPMMHSGAIHMEMSDKTRAINAGGLGTVQAMVKRIGLCEDIDSRLHLLKRHLPYHESDHVLNLAYNAMLDGVRLQDIELRRNDEAFLDALGAQRIPDPTTSGDFTRRFEEDDILDLMEAINETRKRVWHSRGEGFLEEAVIDVDGTIAPTGGECKEGIGLSYRGIWGYAPLVISLANTGEVLYLCNRPANQVSHEGCVEWLDRAIDLVGGQAERILLRGDTDFSLTKEFDRWDRRGVEFVFGMDARPNLVALAEGLGEEHWSRLERRPRYEIATRPRRKRGRIKESIVRLKGYENRVLEAEDVAEIEYQPLKCKRAYRLIIVRKNISVKKGEDVLFDHVRYFFYITNTEDYGSVEVVALANGRCHQENVIEQLKNGVNAMRMPVDDLESNWAYMVMTALAWNLKAWFGLLLPDAERGDEVVRMEFRRFLHSLVLIPAQIVRSGRRIIYRLLSYNSWLKDLFALWEYLRRPLPV